MQANPDCIPYALNQVLATARLVSEDGWIHRKVLLRALADLAEEPDLDKSAPEIIFGCLTTAYKALGVKDPYENEKARSNKAVSALAGELRTGLDTADDRLAAAVRLALDGAAIEAGVQDRVAAEHVLRRARAETPARDDSEPLLRALARAESVLYILNNAGEVILDRLLVEELARGRSVHVVARNGPILNDVTADEAREMGFEAIEGVEVLDPGAPMLGLWVEKAGKKLKRLMKEADVVIAKGQANYESLCNAERELFFLLRARSIAVANRLGVSPDVPVILRHEPAEPAASTADASGAADAADA